MAMPLGPVLAVENHVVADVVGQERTPLLDREGQLLRIAQSGSLQLDDMLCIEATLSKRLRQQQVDIFVNEQTDRRHQPSWPRTTSSLFSSRSRSTSFWWS